MPDIALANHPRMRRYAWPFTIGLTAALALVVVVLSVVAYIQRGQLDAADRRLDAIETGTEIAEVATCYNAARGRPLLGDLLGVMAAAANTPDDRMIVNEAIERYVKSARTEQECDELAFQKGLDPKDFPAPPRREPSG